MKRLDDGSIMLSDDEITDLYEFIRSQLDREWDRHTDQFICSDPWEDGMRRMNPHMYDFAQQLITLQGE